MNQHISEPAGAAEAVGTRRRTRLGPAEAGRCRRRVHLDHDPTQDRTVRLPPDPSVALRVADLDRLRAGIRARIGDTVTGWDPADGSRPPVVADARLRSDTRYATVDLLLWAGDGYVPVLIRGHRTLDPGVGALVSDPADPMRRRLSATVKGRSHPTDQPALTHVHRLLEECGLASATGLGGVIGLGNPEELISWYRRDPGAEAEFDKRFADRLAVAVAAATGAPALAEPSKVGECRRCPWAQVCEVQLQASRDVSLVAPGHDGLVLKEAGILTIDDLAASEAGLLAPLPVTAALRTQGIVRARALQSGAALVRRTDQPQVLRADIELDVDMESYQEDGAYLWGTLLSGSAAGRAVLAEAGYDLAYRPFATWEQLPTPDEGRAFAEFWAYLRALRTLAHERGVTFAAYCYSRQAEERWLLSTPVRYRSVPGMPTPAEITEFIGSPEWVDLFQVIGEEFIVPGSRRLKAIAPVAGFHWRDPEPGGANSMAWYRDAVGPEPDAAQRERVLRYNEDDVIATRELRRWITDRAVAETPSVADLLAAPVSRDRER